MGASPPSRGASLLLQTHPPASWGLSPPVWLFLLVLQSFLKAFSHSERSLRGKERILFHRSRDSISVYGATVGSTAGFPSALSAARTATAIPEITWSQVGAVFIWKPDFFPQILFQTAESVHKTQEGSSKGSGLNWGKVEFRSRLVRSGKSSWLNPGTPATSGPVPRGMAPIHLPGREPMKAVFGGQIPGTA